MNSLYGESIRKIIEEKFAGKSECWMMSEYDERIKKFWKLSHGTYIVKLLDDKRLEDEVKKLNTMPPHLGASVLSNSEKKYEFFHSFY